MERAGPDVVSRLDSFRETGAVCQSSLDPNFVAGAFSAFGDSRWTVGLCTWAWQERDRSSRAGDVTENFAWFGYLGLAVAEIQHLEAVGGVWERTMTYLTGNGDTGWFGCERVVWSRQMQQ